MLVLNTFNKHSSVSINSANAFCCLIQLTYRFHIGFPVIRQLMTTLAVAAGKDYFWHTTAQLLSIDFIKRGYSIYIVGRTFKKVYSNTIVSSIV